MSDVFQEVDQELRRDRLQAWWDRYGVLLISMAIALVLIVAGVEAYKAWRNGRDEEASLRYMAMMDKNAEASDAERMAALEEFIAAEQGGYRVLAQFRYAAEKVEKDDWEAALQSYESIAANGQLPIAIRDFANLQAASVSIGHVSAADVEVRIKRLLVSPSGLQGAAREIMALAYLEADQPILARDLLQVHLAETITTAPMRTRAEILFDEANRALRSQPDTQKGE